MKKLAALALVAVAAVAMSASTASAQTVTLSQGQGFGFGIGLNQSGSGSFGGGAFGGGGFFGRGFGRSANRIAAPPYFAQFPPVYYSGIVKRPYGISPFAAPAGITPVELSHVPPTPQHVKNPYFNPEVQAQPIAEEKTEKAAPSVDGKTTWIVNPYHTRQVSN